MKLSLKLGFASLLVMNGGAQALNPVQGLYGGIFLGGSMSPSISLNVIDPLMFVSTPATLKYKVFVDIGGELGYRINQFRIE